MLIKIHNKARKILEDLEKHNSHLFEKIEEMLLHINEGKIDGEPLSQPFKKYKVKKVKLKHS